jgi:anti-anti-sigma factor
MARLLNRDRQGAGGPTVIQYSSGVKASQCYDNREPTVNPGRTEALKIENLDGPSGSRIMKLTGPLTLQTLFDFQTAARVDTTKPIILDNSKVPYMDSAGLGCVISVFASCQRTGRGFAMIGLAERIRTLFEVTHVTGLIPCFDTLDAAEFAVLKPAV